MVVGEFTTEVDVLVIGAVPAVMWQPFALPSWAKPWLS